MARESWQEALEALCRAIENQLSTALDLFGWLLKGCGALLRRLESAAASRFNGCISGCVRARQWILAMELLEEMSSRKAFETPKTSSPPRGAARPPELQPAADGSELAAGDRDGNGNGLKGMSS